MNNTNIPTLSAAVRKLATTTELAPKAIYERVLPKYPNAKLTTVQGVVFSSRKTAKTGPVPVRRGIKRTARSAPRNVGATGMHAAPRTALAGISPEMHLGIALGTLGVERVEKLIASARV